LWLLRARSADVAIARCDALRQSLEASPLVHAGQILPLTVSMGWCPHPLWPALPTDWHLSLRIADDALYQAKTGGRNRWVGYIAGDPPQAAPRLDATTAELEAAGHLRRQSQGGDEA
jgi:PleD family two-component response regulator